MSWVLYNNVNMGKQYSKYMFKKNAIFFHHFTIIQFFLHDVVKWYVSIRKKKLAENKHNPIKNNDFFITSRWLIIF